MSDYLIHFNRNHNPKNGQFDFGDGDGDGAREYQQRLKEARRLERKDTRWAKRNYNKIYKKAYKPVRREMNQFVKKELNPKYRKDVLTGKMSRSYMNEYNRKLAQLMNMNVSDIKSPSGRVISFIAKRGDIGVHMALSDPQYDMSGFKNGIYGTGRVAYKKNVVNKMI